MSYTTDTMTLCWIGAQEVQEAKRFRQLVGRRAVSSTLKELARAWMASRLEKNKKAP